MDSKPINTHKLQVDFVALASQARETSSQLERGQAEGPITEAFGSLLRGVGDTELVVSILCLSGSAKAAMLNWLSDLEIEPTDTAGGSEPLTRLWLGPVGSPSPANGDRTPLLSADRDTTPDQGSDQGSGQDADPRVTIMMTTDAAQLRDEPHLYQQFCTDGHILLVAGDAQQALTDADRELLANVANTFDVVLPTVIGPRREPAGTSWWDERVLRTHTGRMAPLFLDANTSGGAADVLTQLSISLGSSLCIERHIRQLDGAIENLAKRQDRELNMLEMKQRRMEDAPARVSPRGASSNDKEVARVRDHFSDRLSALEKEINLKSDCATQPLGSLTNLMREHVSKLSLDDLDKQQLPSVTKLSITGSHLAAANRKIEHALRTELTTDVAHIQQGLRQLVAHVTDRLEAIGVEGHVFTISPLAETPIWRTVENLMAIGKESHIELARKGFFDVLTAGRQKVFILIMFVSLMGRMGLPNLFQSGMMRTGFGLFMASVLFGSMINAVFVWRREKVTQSEKEMSKIKDSLFSDGTKVIEQVEKGKLNFLRDYLREVSKSFDQQLKLVAEEHTTRCKADGDLRAKRHESIRKALDTKLKTITEIGRQVGKLNENAKSLRTAAHATIREAARQQVSMSTVATDRVESEDKPARENATSAEASRSNPLDRLANQPKNTTEEPATAAGSSGPAGAATPPPLAVRRTSSLLKRREARRLALQQQQS